jgi:hypothetical protein
MNDVIPHENKELLAQILGEVQNRAYIDVVVIEKALKF